jgi:DNA-binding transcriptional ArsR family regulator
MAQPLVSYHLKVLREAALVNSTLCAGLSVYRVHPDTLTVLADRLTAMAEKAARNRAIKWC